MTYKGHKTTIRLTEENLERVLQHASQHGSTLNSLVNIALDRLFKDLEANKKAS